MVTFGLSQKDFGLNEWLATFPLIAPLFRTKGKAVPRRQNSFSVQVIKVWQTRGILCSKPWNRHFKTWNTYSNVWNGQPQGRNNVWRTGLKTNGAEGTALLSGSIRVLRAINIPGRGISSRTSCGSGKLPSCVSPCTSRCRPSRRAPPCDIRRGSVRAGARS